MSVGLKPRTVFAMPLGPPFGGMTVQARMLRNSILFESGRAILFDTTPPTAPYDLLRRLLHAAHRTVALVALVHRHRATVVYFLSSGHLGFFEKSVMAMFCRLRGARTVLHLVGSVSQFYESRSWSRPIIRLMLRSVDAIMVVEPLAREYVARLAPATPVWLIPNPVACDAYPGTMPRREPGEPVQVLFAGSLVEAKGVLDLLHVACGFRDARPGVQFVIAGDGPLGDACRRFVRQNGLDRFVRLTGFISGEEKRRIFSSSHIFCLPSHAEGTPLAVLEAMAAGLPVIASTVGGLPYVIEHDVNGLLVPPGDVEALERALRRLVESDALRDRMARSGAARVRSAFDLKIVAHAMMWRLNSLDRASDTGRREASESAASGPAESQ